MSRNCAALAVALFIAAVSDRSLTAHHSFLAVFDGTKKVTLTGTLTKVDWRNPHIEIALDVKSDRGRVEKWVVEGAPPSSFSLNKVTRSDFEKAIGQTVSIEIHPARDGDLFGVLLKITFSDGRSIASRPQA